MCPALVLRTCLDETKFLLRARESLAERVAHLAMQSGRLNKGQFDDLQSRVGFNRAPSGMLACQEFMQVLDVAKAVCFNYMYVYFVPGLFLGEVNLMMHKLTTVRMRGPDIHCFFQESRVHVAQLPWVERSACYSNMGAVTRGDFLYLYGTFSKKGVYELNARSLHVSIQSCFLSLHGVYIYI